MKSVFISVLLSSLFYQFALATEVDNFTDRDLPLADSREHLNQKMDKSFANAIKHANSASDCLGNFKETKEIFYKKLDKEIGGFLWAKYEIEVNKNPDLEKRSFARRDSVYKDLDPIDGFALFMADLGYIVNIGGHLVGTDKLGHFIGIGKIYFDQLRLKKKSLKEVMEYGVYTEKTFFGETTTNIYSYGDLVANYEGLLFWQNLFDGESPYIRCEEGELKQIREFDWLVYVNDGWDESINCSTFRNDETKKKVLKAIKENLSETAACPIINLDPVTVERYKETPVKIINTPFSGVLIP